MSPEQLFDALNEYVLEGWLRPLDLALARLLLEQEPQTSAQVLLAAVWASHQLGRGHLCLDIEQLLSLPQQVLALPPEGRKPTQLPLPSALMAQWSPQSWLPALTQAAVVSVDGRDQDSSRPLVLSQGRLYLRRYFRYECQVAQGLADRLTPLTVEAEALRSQLQSLFAPLKSEPEQRGDEVHWQSVAAALACRSRFTVISGGPGTGKTTTVVRLLAALQQLAMDSGTALRIKLAAPTGKAAARLSESLSGALSQLPQAVAAAIPTQVSTLHRLLGSRPDSRQFKHHQGNPLHLDLLVVDEASMVDLEMMAALLAALPPQARLILLGDKDQLASVEAGAVLGDLCEQAAQPRYWPATTDYLYSHSGYQLQDWQGPGTALEQQIALLRKSHRFDADSGIGHLAQAVNDGQPDRANALWHQGWRDLLQRRLTAADDSYLERLCIDGEGEPQEAQRRAMESGCSPRGYGHYLGEMHQGLASLEPLAAQCQSPSQWQALFARQEQWIKSLLKAFGQFQLLCAVRDGDYGVSGLNQRIASALCRRGLISQASGWYAGRPVILSRNDYGLKLMNGDVGLCLPVWDEQGQRRLRVAFLTAEGGVKTVMPSRLSSVETVYAMTVHKSQGSEFAHTAMVLPASDSPILTRELVYTGITRARHWFTLLTPTPRLFVAAIGRRTVRASGLSQRLASLTSLE
ncbi:exodeoxyribonuclease V subunit alpha [Ferrimonas sp. SCSIO 43195]|uniref:exodeoxyribonuclease V subunit alpha n=1 Tax=Ferrimonas sp. SCSIO 43195 TaxID=2822844 RepID=UPI00207606B9|nr:exodeoxyribonuclease V subunit alpha [Ferrimonas sp. SCSIO 43195]USD36018.1 exodeoxyribonuclease V subunit alpha [Ferrimonas sp. SCSIO 43195]